MLANTWKRKQNWIPVSFFLSGLLLVLLLGIAGNRKDDARIVLETRITAEQVRIRLESCFDSRDRLVQTLADYPWRSRAEVTDSWGIRAGTLLPLDSGVQALNYVDQDGVIRVIFPVESNRPALNARLRDNANPSVVSALRAAENSNRMTRTDIVELLQGGKGFALYQKILSEDGEALGVANGVFRVQNLMDSCLPEGRLRDHFAFAFRESDVAFYEQTDPLADGPSPYRVSLPIDVPGSPWSLEFAPLRAYLDATNSIVDEVWILLGLLLTTLLTLATRTVLIKQQDLEESEDKYRLLVENQTDLVVKVDPQGRFQYISPSYCEMFGKSEDELLEKAFLPLVHEDDRELTNRSLESLKSAPHTSYHEQRAMTKNGWRWLAWSNTAVLDERGEIAAITAVGRDVTEIKSLEQNIAHSQKMKAMGETAGGITHDFNNLLQVILGNVEFLLLESKHDEETREALEQVKNVVERGMSLTKKLSTLSRQEITRPEVFDINAFAREIMGLLKHTLPASAKLSLGLSSESLPVLGDRAQLEQVLLNLCFNARDAIDSNGHISIGTSRKTLDSRSLGSQPNLQPGDYVMITVEDDGGGIDPGIVPRIFDPFFTTKVAGTGTGLGLANCYSIIEQHHGMILVGSSPDDGTCFTIYLPLTDASVEQPEEDGPVVPVPVETRGKLILVADDNPQLLKLTCRILENAGFDTLGAANGTQALDLFEAHRDKICLIVMDLVMPEMGGQEVADRVRELCDDVKILFVSGYVPEPLADSVKDTIIRKPYTIEVLIGAVNETLEA